MTIFKRYRKTNIFRNCFYNATELSYRTECAQFTFSTLFDLRLLKILFHSKSITNYFKIYNHITFEITTKTIFKDEKKRSPRDLVELHFKMLQVNRLSINSYLNCNWQWCHLSVFVLDHISFVILSHAIWDFSFERENSFVSCMQIILMNVKDFWIYLRACSYCVTNVLCYLRRSCSPSPKTFTFFVCKDIHLICFFIYPSLQLPNVFMHSVVSDWV